VTLLPTILTQVDLLLGSWAAENVMQLTTPELDEYEAVLNQETIDIFNFVNGKDEPPATLKNNAILKRLQVKAAPGGEGGFVGQKDVMTCLFSPPSVFDR
jgi:succinate dehydrogenase assembly factor 2